MYVTSIQTPALPANLMPEAIITALALLEVPEISRKVIQFWLQILLLCHFTTLTLSLELLNWQVACVTSFLTDLHRSSPSNTLP